MWFWRIEFEKADGLSYEMFSAVGFPTPEQARADKQKRWNAILSTLYAVGMTSITKVEVVTKLLLDKQDLMM